MNHSVAYQVLVQETKKVDTFLGNLVTLADKMISSSNPEMCYKFPRILTNITKLEYDKFSCYMNMNDYISDLTNEEQLTLVLLILQSEGVSYEYHTLEY